MSSTAQAGRVSRREFVARLLRDLTDALVVTGLGSAAYDAFAAGDRDRNYYLWGAMGGAVPLGLGLALAQREKPVVVLTGDGEQLMGLGSLLTVAAKQPGNLSIVVLDNGHFGETGMQKSHSGLGARLEVIAGGAGFTSITEIGDLESIDTFRRKMQKLDGPHFARIHISTAHVDRALPPRDGVFLKNRFRAQLGFAVS